MDTREQTLHNALVQTKARLLDRGQALFDRYVEVTSAIYLLDKSLQMVEDGWAEDDLTDLELERAELVEEERTLLRKIDAVGGWMDTVIELMLEVE